MNRHKIIPAVFLILEKNNKILLLRRKNTGHQDGNYSLPAGHLNGNETVAQAAIREAKEEAGINIFQKNLKLVHVISHKGSDAERVDFFFKVTSWRGFPRNCEPDKCDDIGWFDKKKLPKNTVVYARQALKLIPKGIMYSDWNW